MKTDYRVRAEKFAHVLADLFADCVDLVDFYDAVQRYNTTHRHCAMQIDNGVSRVAIIRSDYVIKFPRQGYSGWAGNNASECALYERAKTEGYSHLLAETTLININGIEIIIMPRVRGIGHTCMNTHATCDELDWLYRNINDLHPFNYGRRNGKVCVIDYAFSS